MERIFIPLGRSSSASVKYRNLEMGKFEGNVREQGCVRLMSTKGARG
jgi:hypothetical protein